jgi:hypothetical protein
MDATAHPPASIEKQVINAAGSGIDPMLAAIMGQGGFGGGNNNLLWILLLLFGRGGWGGFGGGAGACAGLTEQSIVTSKDVTAQLTAFQSWASTNAAQLAQQLCTSTASITAAVSALTPQMMSQFNAMQQSNSAAFGLVGQGINGLEKSLDTGFAATNLGICQTQNLIQSTACDNKTTTIAQANELSKQLAACCCENRLAIANQNALIERNTAAVQNQINMQTCEIKQSISTDGQATRALINDLRLAEVQEELNSTKAALSACQASANNASQLQTAVSTILAHCGCGGNGNGNNSRV